MDFKSGQQLIGLCETNECPISEIMLIREETFTERTRKDIINQMGKTWQINERICPFHLLKIQNIP